jgi:hypothetical protein
MQNSWNVYVPLDTGDLFLSGFDPIPQLARHDAEVFVLALHKHLAYTHPVSDPWFLASVGQSSTSLHLAGNTTLYPPDSPVSFLAATFQVQFCHSTDFATSCSPLKGLYQTERALAAPSSANFSAYGLAAFHDMQLATATLLYTATTFSLFSNTVAGLGASVLSAWGQTWGSNTHMSGGLARTQWQTEAWNFHNLTLAGLQRTLIEHVAPAVVTLQNGRNTSLDYLHQVNASDSTAVALCSTMKMRNAAFSSFSLLGLIIILVVGSVIILTNLVLTDTVRAIANRAAVSSSSHRSSWDPTPLSRNLSWLHAGFLHLQRQMLEERGIGPWKRLDNVVPVTRDFGREFDAEVPDVHEKEKEDTEQRLGEAATCLRSQDGAADIQGAGEIYRRPPPPRYGYISIPVQMV